MIQNWIDNKNDQTCRKQTTLGLHHYLLIKFWSSRSLNVENTIDLNKTYLNTFSSSAEGMSILSLTC